MNYGRPERLFGFIRNKNDTQCSLPLLEEIAKDGENEFLKKQIIDMKNPVGMKLW